MFGRPRLITPYTSQVTKEGVKTLRLIVPYTSRVTKAVVRRPRLFTPDNTENHMTDEEVEREGGGG